MKIASITKFKHGILREALVKLGWTQSEFARRLGYSVNYIAYVLNLQTRPNKEAMDKIQLILGKEGIYIDILECWPEEFTGSRKRIIVEKSHDFDPETLLGCQKSLLLEQQNQEMFEDSLVSKRTAQKERLYKAMDTLKEIEKEVLIRTFINGETLDEIGKTGGVCKDRVAQVRNIALGKLRDIKRLRIIEGVEEKSDEALLEVSKQQEEDRAIGFTRFKPQSDIKPDRRSQDEITRQYQKEQLRLFPHLKPHKSTSSTAS